MKWRAPSERVQGWLVAPIAIPAAACLFVLIAPAIPVIWAWDRWDRYRFRKPWHRWFAWRPVMLGEWFEDERRWVWLEMVERVRAKYHSEWIYRLPAQAMSAGTAKTEGLGGDSPASAVGNADAPKGDHP